MAEIIKISFVLFKLKWNHILFFSFINISFLSFAYNLFMFCFLIYHWGILVLILATSEVSIVSDLKFDSPGNIFMLYYEEFTLSNLLFRYYVTFYFILFLLYYGDLGFLVLQNQRWQCHETSKSLILWKIYLIYFMLLIKSIWFQQKSRYAWELTLLLCIEIFLQTR